MRRLIVGGIVVGLMIFLLLFTFKNILSLVEKLNQLESEMMKLDKEITKIEKQAKYQEARIRPILDKVLDKAGVKTLVELEVVVIPVPGRMAYTFRNQQTKVPVIGVDLVWAATISEGAMEGLMAHEVSHIICGHIDIPNKKYFPVIGEPQAEKQAQNLVSEEVFLEYSQARGYPLEIAMNYATALKEFLPQTCTGR